MSALLPTGSMRYTHDGAKRACPVPCQRSLHGDRRTTTCGVNLAHITSVLSLQGRSRRNAQRQLAVIRLARAQEAEAARAVARQQASASPPVTGKPCTPW